MMVCHLEKRFRDDPSFHHVVIALEQIIARNLLSPSDVKDAAMLAAMRVDIRGRQTAPAADQSFVVLPKGSK